MAEHSTVQHEPAEQRFSLRLADGSTAVLAYREVGRDVLDLRHTIVPDEHRGQGIGERLVRAALDHARARGMRVVPTCRFVAAWLDAHPEDRALVAAG